MDADKFAELLKAALSSGQVVARPETKSKIDTVVPLPVGSKSLIGWLGTVLTGGSLLSGLVPHDAVGGIDWRTVVELLCTAFMALGGAGVIAKYQRYLNTTTEVLKVLLQISQIIQDKTQNAGGGS